MDILNISPHFEKAMDVASLRQQVIANNISNVNTPGFAPSKVCFEDELKKCMVAKEDQDGFQVVCDFTDADLGVKGTPTDESKVNPAVVKSGKSVDINQEMVDLAKNGIIFEALSSQATGRYSGFKYIIENFGR
ncbi:MAG: flagellar basal body rod protein FlgB [Candidatus Xenobiia bacterium LiM19]